VKKEWKIVQKRINDKVKWHHLPPILPVDEEFKSSKALYEYDNFLKTYKVKYIYRQAQ